MALTNKRKMFVREYLRDFNATRAAKAAGYSAKTAYSYGQQLLKNLEVYAAIQAEIAELTMTADEMLIRLAAIARGDIADLLDIHATGYNLKLMVRDEKGNLIVNPNTALIRKIKQKATTVLSEQSGDRETIETEIELYSALDALDKIGKVHKLFTDRTELTGPDGGAIRVTRVKPDQDDD